MNQRTQHRPRTRAITAVAVCGLVASAVSNLAAADVDADGNMDLAVANYRIFEDNGAVSILRGDGTGSLLAATPYLIGRRPWKLEAGDLDGDGDTDLVGVVHSARGGEHLCLLGQSYYQFHFDKHRDEVFTSIVAMQELLDQRGLEFQVVLLPVFPKRRPSFDDYPFFAIHDEIMAFFNQEEISAIDLLGAFQSSSRPPWEFSSDQWHPNPLGHEFIAEQLRVIAEGRGADPPS